jgi:hypothetical protein
VRVLSEHGVDPAPDRSKHTSWTAFLKAHWGGIAATDFFTVEVLTVGGLVRYFVLFVMDLKIRRIHSAGITNQPHDAWMQQVARNLTTMSMASCATLATSPWKREQLGGTLNFYFREAA